MRKSNSILKPILLVSSIMLMCIGCTPPDKIDGGGNNGGKEPPGPDPKTLGLYVENGTLMMDGKPYYGMGINYFSLFNDYNEKTRLSTLDGLRALDRAGVAFVRFPSGPYWPLSWRNTYFKDKEAYFTRLDDVVELAEELGIGLIPSLFWHMPTVPDLMGENMDAFGDSNSKTIGFIRQYTREVGERYKDSPAIWGWEFGNEFNLFIDIPHPALPPNPVEMGCPPNRDQIRDRMYNAHMINAFKEFGAIVREYDTYDRAIFSGNSEPRPSAWNNAFGYPWVSDTYDQYKEIIGRFECDPVNTVTARGYFRYESNPPMGLYTMSGYVEAMMKISKALGKPLFIGEFGVSDVDEPLPTGLSEAERAREMKKTFMMKLDAIVYNRVPLSAMWVFDLPQQDASCSITFSNNRAYMIEELVKAHDKLQQNVK